LAEPAIRVRNFSHICVSVSDMERSLAFYRDVLGLVPIFDVALEGDGMAAATGEAGAHGRMVGCKVPGSGVTIELLCFGHARAGAARASAPRPTGYTNISLCVDDLDASYDGFVAHGVTPLQKPFDVGGVRMFFVADPDGTAIEVIAFPHGATTSAEHNGA
jgi:glyoxylase I family protein